MRTRGSFDVLVDDFAEGEDVTYSIDWSHWLDADSINSSSIAPGTQDTLVIAVEENTLTEQRFRVSGGVAGDIYHGVASIVTTGGDILKASIRIEVQTP